VLAAAPVLLNQVRIGKRCLWVFVQVLHVGMRGRAVEIEVVLFDILAVIPFASRQPKQALFQDRIMFIPESDGEAEVLVAVANSSNAIFIPAVGAGARVVVGQIIPGGAVGTVILTHRAPGALAQIWSPALPVFLAILRLG